MAKEQLLTVGEVASYLSCSVSTVRRLAGRDKIPHYRLGKMVRFRMGEIDSWLATLHGGEIPAEVRSPAANLNQLSLFDS